MAKVLVTLDDRLLARIDREASRRGLSRSAYLARLAALELDDRSGPGRTASSRRALTAIDGLFAQLPVTEDPTDAIRRERDSR
ncbi:MAG: hypothetical protein AAB198_04830 [Actinomycetota bacterium]